MEQRITRLCGVAVCLGFAALGCGSDSGGGSAGTAAAGTGAAASPATGGTGLAGTTATGGTGAAGTAATGMPLPLTDPMVMMCVTDALGRGTTQACAECTCQNCLMEAQTVYTNADPAVGMKAQALVTCAQTTCCAGTSCYCGSDIVSCLMAGMEMGPCKAEVEAAAGGMGVAGVMTPCADPTNACGAANALGKCVTGDPMPLSGSPIVGKCTAQCMTCTPMP